MRMYIVHVVADYYMVYPRIFAMTLLRSGYWYGSILVPSLGARH